MKVAYNNCYGGFGLSPLAETEYQKKKGVKLYWYAVIGKHPDYTYTRVDDLVEFDYKKTFHPLEASLVDLGENVSEIPNEHYHYDGLFSEKRSDPDLIEVIETLGEKANGMCSSLAIEEIPDGADYEISEYDGMESVVPPRMTW